MLNIEPRHVKIKDYSDQDYEEDDEKDFEIRTINEDRLIDPVPGLDDEQEFEADMYNYGEEEDLPDSDREAECQGKGIGRKRCLNR